MAEQVTVASIRHPYYTEQFRNWELWRDTYANGERFIDRYLKKFSNREGADAYAARKAITYNPAFAKQAVNEVKNSIFGRLNDISRQGGSKTYNEAVKGLQGGIDLLGSSMNSFIGMRILPELLPMARVGIYVDMPKLSGVTVASAVGKRPYVYVYPTEDICSWSYDEGTNQNEFNNVLLRDYYFTYDEKTGLPSGNITRYRRLWTVDGKVRVSFFNSDGKVTNQEGQILDSAGGFAEGDMGAAYIGTPEYIELDIPRIPFYIVEISNSLLEDVAKIQVALLNLASSDIAYSLNSNFPFYTESFEPRNVSEHLRRVGQGQGGEAADAVAGKAEEVKVGTTVGRRYPKGVDRPGFIHPSSEPLQASMQKQEQLKAEIRQLVNLSVQNLQPTKQASAESKGMDRQGLESGLSYIGLALEQMERKIADFWDMYENGKNVATINYPETYEIKTESEKQAEAETLTKLLVVVPSATYRKSILQRIAELTVGRKISEADLKKIMSEIKGAKGMTADPEVIAKHLEVGIVDKELASELSGYPEGTVKKAEKEHAERLALIAESQAPKGQPADAGARGVQDQDANPTASGSEEKKASRDTTTDATVKDKQRGAGKSAQPGDGATKVEE